MAACRAAFTQVEDLRLVFAFASNKTSSPALPSNYQVQPTVSDCKRLQANSKQLRALALATGRVSVSETNKQKKQALVFSVDERKSRQKKRTCTRQNLTTNFCLPFLLTGSKPKVPLLDAVDTCRAMGRWGSTRKSQRWTILESFKSTSDRSYIPVNDLCLSDKIERSSVFYDLHGFCDVAEASRTTCTTQRMFPALYAACSSAQILRGNVKATAMGSAVVRS